MRRNLAGSEGDLVETFLAFVNAKTWDDSRKVLVGHPELLEDEVDAAIEQLIEEASRQNADDAVATLRNYLELLHRIREVGAEAAFAAIMGAGQDADRIEDLETSALPSSLSHLSVYQVGSGEAIDLGSTLAAMESSMAWAAPRTSPDKSADSTDLATIQAELDEVETLLARPSIDSPARSQALKRRAGLFSDIYALAWDPTWLQRAIVDLDAALKGVPLGEQDRALLLDARADARYALSSWMWDDGGANLEAAHADIEAALEAAGTGPNKATVLLHRARLYSDQYDATGDPTHLEGAIEDLGVLVQSNSSGDLPGLLAWRSRLLSRRYANTNDVSDLNLAVTDVQAALALTPVESRERPAWTASAADLLLRRYDRVGHHLDLDAAAVDIDGALAATGPERPERARYLGLRAELFWHRYRQTRLLQHLQAALDDSDAAIASMEALGMLASSGRLIDRGRLLSEMYDRTGRLTDLNEAIAGSANALASMPRSHRERPEVLSNLVKLLLDRHLATGSSRDLEDAMHASDAVLADESADSRERLRHLSNRVGVLSARYAANDDRSDIDQAISTIQVAIDATPIDSPDRPGRLNNRAVLLLRRYEAVGDPTDLESAIGDIDGALAKTEPYSPQRPVRLNTRAIAFSQRYASTGSLGDIEAAVAAYREACKTGLVVAPRISLVAARNWSRWAGERGAWDEAAEAACYGLEAGDWLVRAQAGRTDKEPWLGSMQGLAARAAYAFAMLDKLEESAVAAERGRAVLLAEAVAVRSIMARLRAMTPDGEGLAVAYEAAAAKVTGEIPGVATSGFNPRRDAEAALKATIDAIEAQPGFAGVLQQRAHDEVYSTILASSVEQPLVYLLAAESGGFALVIRSSGSLMRIALPALTKIALGELVGPYLDGFNSAQDGSLSQLDWRVIIDQTAHELWPMFGAALSEACAEAGISSVSLVPLGALGILPLHAAWTEDSRQPSGRRYLGDDLCLTYAPSAQALVASLSARPAQVETLFAVEDPRPTGEPPLTAAGLEVSAAAITFASPTILPHEQATKDAVLAGLGHAAVVHFACHGRADLRDPLQSSLLLAHRQRLALADLLTRQLEGTRLVVLSACQTALPGSELLDEVVSLPATLLQAGAAAAIGSLWSVDDFATALLLGRFYEIWQRGQGRSLAAALQDAQVWLRELSLQERDAALQGLDARDSGDAAPCPYASPYWWAGFTVTGA
jgi:CHAT domain-containing protein